MPGGAAEEKENHHLLRLKKKTSLYSMRIGSSVNNLKKMNIERKEEKPWVYTIYIYVIVYT